MLGLNIAVTGHRLNRISQRQLDRLTPQVRPMLAHIAAAARTPALTLISGLAEGADRHLAELALAQGYALHAVLPFARHTYEQDFASARSRQQFNTLLDRAQRITELPGQATAAGQAYRRAGHALLADAHILLAVWDGLGAQGAGGTAEVVSEACRRRIPVIHVSTMARTPPALIWQPRGRQARDAAGPTRPCGRAELAAVVSHVMRVAR